MNPTTEPLRLRMFIISLVIIGAEVAMSVLRAHDLKAGITEGLGTLVLMLGGTESARAQVTPVASIDTMLADRAGELRQTIADAQAALDRLAALAVTAAPPAPVPPPSILPVVAPAAPVSSTVVGG